MHTAGDPEQRFRSLYDWMYPDILGYLARRIGQQEAVDAAADVFVVVWGRIDDVPEGDAARPWLFGVARNVLRNRRRAARRYWRFLERYRGLGAIGPKNRNQSWCVARIMRPWSRRWSGFALGSRSCCDWWPGRNCLTRRSPSFWVVRDMRSISGYSEHFTIWRA